MWEDLENEFEQNELDFQITRFESLISKNQSAFFDVDVFEDLIDHYLYSNQIKKSSLCVDMALEHYPQSTIFKLRKAQILLNSGKLNAALLLLDEIELIEPSNEEILLAKATVFSQQKNVKGAIDYFEKALVILGDEDSDDIFLDLAIEYENNKAFDKAVAVLERALKINPENESALYELAYCYESMQEFGDAVNYYNDFIDKNPYSYIAWYNLGNAYVKLEDYNKAVWSYDYCNIINDDFYSAFYNKANALCHLEKYEEAIDAYFCSLSDTIADALTYCYVGECYEKMENYQEALSYYKKSIEVNPDLSDSWLGIGVVYDCLNEIKTAIPYFIKALEIDDENPENYCLLAEAYEKVENSKEEEKTYLLGLNSIPDDSEIVKGFVAFLERENRLKEAIAHLEKFLMTNKVNELSMIMVRLYWHDHRFTDSILLCDQTLGKDFNSYNSLLLHFPESEMIAEFTNIIELNRPK